MGTLDAVRPARLTKRAMLRPSFVPPWAAVAVADNCRVPEHHRHGGGELPLCGALTGQGDGGAPSGDNASPGARNLSANYPGGLREVVNLRDRRDHLPP